MLDFHFWLVFGVGAAICGAGVLTLRTGRTPLYWLAIALLSLEAALRRLARSLVLAALDFRAGYARDLREVLLEPSERVHLKRSPVYGVQERAVFGRELGL
jgi:hypothetical protein